jgi:hypothetical protein
MWRLLAVFAVALLGLVGAGSSSADPVKHFGTFVNDCGEYGTVEIVSKPGSSQVVALNGAPSNSVALLVDYELFIDGEFIDFTPGAQYQPPGIQNNQTLVVCYDVSLTLPDYFKAWVLFTPAKPGK